MIYFIRDPEHGMVKIGTSKGVLTRLRSLRAKHGTHLFLEFVREGSFKEEKRLHQLFAHLRVKGEWFFWAEEMLALRQEGLVPIHSMSLQSITLDSDLKEEITRLAAKENRSVSNMIETLLKEAVGVRKGAKA